MEASPEDVQFHFQQASLHDIQTNADTESPPNAPEADCHTSGLCQACPGVGSIPSQRPMILTTSRFSGSVIMAITYGYNAVPENDPFVSKAMQLAELVANVVTIERAVLLSTFPICEFTRITFAERAGQLRFQCHTSLHGCLGDATSGGRQKAVRCRGKLWMSRSVALNKTW